MLLNDLITVKSIPTKICKHFANCCKLVLASSDNLDVPFVFEAYSYLQPINVPGCAFARCGRCGV